MPNFRRHLPRPWFLAASAAFIGLVTLHPYPRQLLFGPKINGVPWCIWEEEAWMCVHPEAKQSWLAKALEGIGLSRGNGRMLDRDDFHLQEALPLHLHLADDGDPQLRKFALDHLLAAQKKKRGEFEAVFREHLDDDDPKCRMLAAAGVWANQHDLALKAVALPLVDHRDELVRRMAIGLLSEMAPLDAELFEPLAGLTGGSVSWERLTALNAMRHFGKRAVPVLAKALRDPDARVRRDAVWLAASMAKDADELIPQIVEYAR